MTNMYDMYIVANFVITWPPGKSNQTENWKSPELLSPACIFTIKSKIY